MKCKLSFDVGQRQPHTEQGASTPWSLKDRRLYLHLSQWPPGLGAMTTVVVGYVSDEVQVQTMTPPGRAAGLPQPWDQAPATLLGSLGHEHLSFQIRIRTVWELGRHGI